MDATVLNEVVLTSYSGPRDDAGCPHGEGGNASLLSGLIYSGTFNEGMMHGQGLLKFPNGTVYEGVMTSNRLTGFGEMRHVADGSVYRGDFMNGVRHGRGVLMVPDKMTYDGDWVQGKRQGFGKQTEGPVCLYEGEWKDDLPDGFGRRVYQSGSVYEGSWTAGVRTGRGKMTWKELDVSLELGRLDRQSQSLGSTSLPQPSQQPSQPHAGYVVTAVYEGEWEENLPHGQGLYTWITHGSVQNRYQGAIYRGMRHGTGTFFYADGSKYVGEWQANKKHGKGTLTEPSGTLKRGIFVEDKFISTETSVTAPSNGVLALAINVDDVLLKFTSNAAKPLHALRKDAMDALARHAAVLRAVFRRYRDEKDMERMFMDKFWLFCSELLPTVKAALGVAELDRIFIRSARHSPSVVYASPDAAAMTESVAENGGLHEAAGRSMTFRDFCEAIIRIAARWLPSRDVTQTVESLLAMLQDALSLQCQPVPSPPAAAVDTGSHSPGVQRPVEFTTVTGRVSADILVRLRGVFQHLALSRTDWGPDFSLSSTSPSASGNAVLFSRALDLPRTLRSSHRSNHCGTAHEESTASVSLSNAEQDRFLELKRKADALEAALRHVNAYQDDDGIDAETGEMTSTEQQQQQQQQQQQPENEQPQPQPQPQQPAAATCEDDSDPAAAGRGKKSPIPHLSPQAARPSSANSSVGTSATGNPAGRRAKVLTGRLSPFAMLSYEPPMSIQTETVVDHETVTVRDLMRILKERKCFDAGFRPMDVVRLFQTSSASANAAAATGQQQQQQQQPENEQPQAQAAEDPSLVVEHELIFSEFVQALEDCSRLRKDSDACHVMKAVAGMALASG